MNKKLCIITGANAGIGKQAAVQIGTRNHHVILACRNRQSGEAALEELRQTDSSFSGELRIVDMSLRKSITEFADEINKEFDCVDVLIHNAAIFNVTQKVRQETDEGIETVWATNHLGPVLLTALLKEKIVKSEAGRILTISSKGLLAKPFLKVDTEDVEFKIKRFSVVNAYYQSKLAQMMFTLWLAERMKGANVDVNCIRVTAVKVDIARHGNLSPFMKWVYTQKAKNSLEPSEMAKTYTEMAISETFVGKTGKYFDENRQEVSMGKYCSDPMNIEAIMSLTARSVPEIRNL